ncbi:DUF2577 domain-containing protein [Paenibacillus sediminis]|uniref:Sporulation protein YlmC with PRC-barrel domain n=1 Tax=Paenibacillus sediminis TaxID=664909 RepID=A0ABS4H770_9BACL|nr:DUF2577 domain-containing protein [Paenibacillus sediminis]MBP1938202.1 sporulation protein YlmC with PRC-barrel domain [Paenibacillus sediminis]
MAHQLIEGNGFSQLKDIVKKVGYNKDVDIEFATVTSPPPSLRIQIDNMKFELDADDFVVCESLTKHTRKASISGGATVDIEFEDVLTAGDRIVVASINNGQRYVIIDRIGGA